VPAPKTKIHHLQFVTESVLAISTEDGRIVFFDTDAPASQGDAESIPAFAVVGQMGGAGDGGPSRIKEFAILPLSSDDQGASLGLLIAAGSSDGMVRVWSLKGGELSGSNPADDSGAVKQVGTLLGEYATANRITCLVGFVMGPALTAIDAVENGHEDDGSDDDVSMEDS
jgi:protein MAK11